MFYWILLIISFIGLIAIVSCILYTLHKKRKYGIFEKENFAAYIGILCLVLFLFVPACIDLPSALRGGQEVYVDEVPTVIMYTPHFSRVETDNEILKHIKGCYWQSLDKNKNYRVRYTKCFKFALDVEQLD